ncbi:MAG: hypothetical protein CV087_07570 [Candidatus Brocadia sp. WS118]|nr:MAG: hypothetical protein CV087_07570 [Candidatus Brocadia sp. WS118]
MRYLILLFAIGLFSVGISQSGESDNWQPTKQEVQVVSTAGEKLIQMQNAIYIDIDLSSYNFKEAPFVITFLAGQKNHWEAHGVNALYQFTPKGFRIYLHYRDGITPEQAKAWKWKLHWKIL